MLHSFFPHVSLHLSPPYSISQEAALKIEYTAKNVLAFWLPVELS